jgi:predicted alpha/beta superfamily hydrolase
MIGRGRRALLAALGLCGLLAARTAAAADGAAAAANAPAPAPHHVIGNSEVRVLPRSANGRDYMLYVALPPSYAKEPARRYPVLYLCDGYWDFALVNGFYGGLLYDKAAPEAIIVGFGYPGANPDYNALRAYDYTPVPNPETDPHGKATGHGAEFLRVIETEFIPFVEREYRADRAFRVLGGSSLGGLFTLYAMLERPGLFQGYIAPSPAVDWAHGWLFDREAAVAAKHPDLRARLFMTGAGAEAPAFLAAIQRFNDRLQSRRYPNLLYKWRLVDGERHAGTKPESFNRGIRYVLAPLAPSPSEN